MVNTVRTVVHHCWYARVLRRLVVDPDSSPLDRVSQGLGGVVEIVQGTEAMCRTTWPFDHQIGRVKIGVRGFGPGRQAVAFMVHPIADRADAPHLGNDRLRVSRPARDRDGASLADLHHLVWTFRSRSHRCLNGSHMVRHAAFPARGNGPRGCSATEIRLNVAHDWTHPLPQPRPSVRARSRTVVGC